MSIRVKDFKWDKGKNDLEYIELLEKNLDSSLSTYRECSKVAREQYKKGYDKGRKDVIESMLGTLDELKLLEREMQKYFCMVDVDYVETNLEKLALNIVCDGMQIIGFLNQQLAQLKE